MPYFNYRKKNVYYEEKGEGDVVILVHGNTVSSKIFDSIVDLYRGYKVVTIDFLGHGKSDRVDNFETDFWYDEGKQLKILIEEKGYKNASVIGTSGGAIAALNLALESPHLIKCVIADSFMGERQDEKVVSKIIEERERKKESKEAVSLWQANHGDTWMNVIDNDTEMLKRHAELIREYFHRSICELKVPALFTASSDDNLIPGADKIAIKLSKKAVNGRCYIFMKGSHPAMLTNPNNFAQIATDFISSIK